MNIERAGSGLGALWDEVQRFWRKLSLREQGLIFGVFAVAGFAAIDVLIWAPTELRERVLRAQLSGISSEQVLLEQQLAKVKPEESASDAARKAEVRVETLQREISMLDQRLQGAREALVSPKEMSKQLRQLVESEGQVRLVGLKTHRAIAEKDSTPTNDKAMTAIYRHPLSFELEGGFYPMVQFLEQLERRLPTLRIQKVEFDGQSHPVIRARFEAYTLSEDRVWARL